MLRLRHFGPDGQEFLLNPDLILTTEVKPDTIIHLTNGTELYVQETPDEIVEKIIDFRARIQRRALTGEGLA